MVSTRRIPLACTPLDYGTIVAIVALAITAAKLCLARHKDLRAYLNSESDASDGDDDTFESSSVIEGAPKPCVKEIVGLQSEKKTISKRLTTQECLFFCKARGSREPTNNVRV